MKDKTNALFDRILSAVLLIASIFAIVVLGFGMFFAISMSSAWVPVMIFGIPLLTASGAIYYWFRRGGTQKQNEIQNTYSKRREEAALAEPGSRGEMRFTKGTGDMGQFFMQQALKRGARPIATTGLPAITGTWSYSEDEYGVVFHLPRERFSAVDAFLRQAFGAPAHEASEGTDGSKMGWYAAKTLGVALQFGYDHKRTQVIVLRPVPSSMIIKGIEAWEERRGE